VTARVQQLRDRARLAVKPLRWWMQVRALGPLSDGVTVVIVNWDSLAYLKVSVEAVRRLSPTSTRIIVVDNDSSDGSIAWLASEHVRAVKLPKNVGHGSAMDIGFLSARTRYVIALDVDAFPIDPSWIDDLTGRLKDGVHVAGAHGGSALDALSPEVSDGWRDRDFVHPCCLALELRRFVSGKHSFMKDTVKNIDTGERITLAEAGHLSFLEVTFVTGPGILGTVFGGVVYHNFYSTRYRRERLDTLDGVSVRDAERVWIESVERYLGYTPAM